MLEKIREIVKKEAEEEDWKYHIVPVVEYAKKLAKILKVDEEIVELAALLHDIGRLKNVDNENHHLTGAVEAEKILKEHNYPEPVIEEVKHCIESHRGSEDIAPRTIIAKIIANADAMAHFDAVPRLIYWRCQEGKGFEETLNWLYDKIERDWNKKLTLPEARKLVESKYKAIKLVLDSNKEYI